jgi:hypothetical protein
MSTAKKVEKTLNVFYTIYRGCGWLLINLFVLGFLCWTSYMTFSGYRVETNGESTTGHVVHLDHFDGGAYAAVVEFEANGQTYTFKDDTASNPPRYEVGEDVPVLYDRTNPNLAHIDDSLLPLWLFPGCMVGVLLVGFVAANIWGVRAWKRGEEMIDLT